MKVLILFAAIAATQAASLVYHHPAALLGGSAQYHSQDIMVHRARKITRPVMGGFSSFWENGTAKARTDLVLGNYAFGYNEGNYGGATFRREVGDAAGKKVGSYGLTDADGKVRVVEYVADAGGFKANIKTNEKGVETKNPANVEITKAELAKTYPVVSPYLPHYYGYPAFGGHVVVL